MITKRFFSKGYNVHLQHSHIVLDVDDTIYQNFEYTKYFYTEIKGKVLSNVEVMYVDPSIIEIHRDFQFINGMPRYSDAEKFILSCFESKVRITLLSVRHVESLEIVKEQLLLLRKTGLSYDKDLISLESCYDRLYNPVNLFKAKSLYFSYPENQKVDLYVEDNRVYLAAALKYINCGILIDRGNIKDREHYKNNQHLITEGTPVISDFNQLRLR